MDFSFRLRCNQDNREAWINAIHIHLPDQVFNTSFYVCIRHFAVPDYTKQKEGKFTLHPNAVPTIFENQLETANSNIDFVDGIELNQEANEVVEEIEEIDPINSGSESPETCETIQASEKGQKSEIEQLNSEIFKLKLDYDVKIQALTAQTDVLKNKLEAKTDTLHTLRNDLDRKNGKIKRLEEMIAELRRSHIAANIPNVNIYICFILYCF